MEQQRGDNLPSKTATKTKENKVRTCGGQGTMYRLTLWMGVALLVAYATANAIEPRNGS